MPSGRLVSLALLLALGLVAIATDAAAHATDPPELLGNADVVHACVSSRGGMVQVVDPSTGACSFGGTPLHWGLVGPAGTPASGKTVLSGGTCGGIDVSGQSGTFQSFRPGACADPLLIGLAAYPIPFDGSLSTLRVQVDRLEVASVHTTVRVDSVATPLACSIAPGEDHCAELTQTVPVVGGSLLLIELFVTNPPPFDSAGFKDLAYSFVLTPSAP